MSISQPTATCGNEDHARPIPAVARLSWPDGRYRPNMACATDLRLQVRGSLDDGHPVLVEPTGGSTHPTIKAIHEVTRLHLRERGQPTRAIILQAPDHPAYEELPETIEERRKLPARFHTPHWLELSTPVWVCAVCWEPDAIYQWPCATAAKHGGEVFAR